MIFYELVTKNTVIGVFYDHGKALKAMLDMAPGLKVFIRTRGLSE